MGKRIVYCIFQKDRFLNTSPHPKNLAKKSLQKYSSPNKKDICTNCMTESQIYVGNIAFPALPYFLFKADGYLAHYGVLGGQAFFLSNEKQIFQMEDEW